MRKFSRQSRIASAREFDEVFSKGQWQRSDPYIHLLWMLREEGRARLGIKISKKNIRSVPDRNRLKRIIRESFRHQIEALGAYDCIVLIRKGAEALPNYVFRQHVDRLWILFKKP